MGETSILVIAVLAGVVYVSSLVLLARMMFRILRWLLRHRRPELGTEARDGFFSLVYGFVSLGIAPLVAYGPITGHPATAEFVVALFGAALANGFGWIQLRISFSVALAELRYALARQRRLRARAQGRFDPAAAEEERRAERDYLATRHWEQEL